MPELQETTVTFQHEEEIVLSKKKINRIGRPFDSFGTDPHQKGLSSIYDVLEQLDSKSLKLFCMLAKKKDYNTNEVVLIRKQLTKEQILNLNKGYKKLEELNVVRRIRSETYILNPDYVIPNTTKLQEIKKKYEAHQAETAKPQKAKEAIT